MKRLLVFIVAFFSALTLCAQGSVLSPSATISLLTFAPGQEAYAAFGHSGIRVHDAEKQLDVTFNYGTFNFNAPNFYAKFIAGETYYHLSVDNTEGVLLHYMLERRGVREQVLNLTEEEKQRLWLALLDNMRPENLTYLYNFVYDNCATRPRDIIEHSVEDERVNYQPLQSNESFRDLIARYVGEDTWTKFGIDLIVGAEADNVVSQYVRMFLPDEVESQFATATKVDGEPLVMTSNQLVSDFEPEKDSPFVEPLGAFLFFLLLVIVVTIILPTYLKAFDVVLFSLSGALGCLIVYLSFFSLHPLVHHNFNLLWLSPFSIAFAIAICFRSLRKLSVVLDALLFVSVLLPVVGYLFLPQQFNIAFLPLMLVLAVRLAGRMMELRKG